MITVIGASGKTGMKTAETLMKRGEKVRCVGRSAERLLPLTNLGAEASIGDMADIEFLTSCFAGADGAYILIPSKNDTDNVRGYYNLMGKAVVKAIRSSGLKKIVFLSSLGAERDAGTGPVLGLHDLERSLDILVGTDIIFLRAGYFYENTLMNVGLIKSKKINACPIDPDAQVCMVASRDIGEKAAELLSKRRFKSHTVFDFFGQRLSYREVTRIIGMKLGLPELHCVFPTDLDAIQSLMAMGMSRSVAASMVELSHAIGNGRVTSTKLTNAKPNAPTRFSSFVEEIFYSAYHTTA